MITTNAKNRSLVSRLSGLVQARTLTSDHKACSGVLHQLASELEAYGLTVHVGTNGGFPYLYAHFLPLSQTQVWLYAHVDVVDGHEGQFTLKQQSGRLFGRGAYDMKFAIAVYMQLCADLSGSRPPIGLVITSDEEATGEFGAGFMAPMLQLQGKTVIMPDGGGPWSIEQAAKGLIWCRLESAGTAAHGSHPELGSNAIDTLVQTIADIKSALHAASGKSFHDTTVNVGVIKGGSVANQVPSHAAAELDIRFAPDMTSQKVEHIIRGIAKKTSVDVTITNSFPAVAHRMDHPDVTWMKSLIEDVTGHVAPFVNSYGASDAFFFEQVGAATIVFYPDGGNHHGADEYITLEGLTGMYDVLNKFVQGIRTAQATQSNKKKP